MSKRPLEGLKVLDFTHVVAGPFATRVLGDLGADVIKINCEARALTSNAPEHPFYIMWNRNKRALSLNMSTEEGRRLGKRLRQSRSTRRHLMVVMPSDVRIWVITFRWAFWIVGAWGIKTRSRTIPA